MPIICRRPISTDGTSTGKGLPAYEAVETSAACADARRVGLASFDAGRPGRQDPGKTFKNKKIRVKGVDRLRRSTQGRADDVVRGLILVRGCAGRMAVGSRCAMQ